MPDLWANYIIALLSLFVALLTWFGIRPRDVARATRDAETVIRREARRPKFLVLTLLILSIGLQLGAVVAVAIGIVYEIRQGANWEAVAISLGAFFAIV